jgi:hypothetical protein
VRFSAFFEKACNGDALYFGLFAYKISHLSKKKKKSIKQTSKQTDEAGCRTCLTSYRTSSCRSQKLFIMLWYIKYIKINKHPD